MSDTTDLFAPRRERESRLEALILRETKEAKAAFKDECARRRISMSDAMREALRDWMAKG